jgi:hypothetical protein
LKNKNSYLGRSGDAHLLVDALERNTVDLARAGDQKKTRVKHLQEDNALAAEAAAKKDQDLAGGDVLLEDGLGGLEGLASHGPILDERCKERNTKRKVFNKIDVLMVFKAGLFQNKFHGRMIQKLADEKLKAYFLPARWRN